MRCEAWLRSHGVKVEVLDLSECVDLMNAFIARCPDIWNEDIGEETEEDGR